MVERTGIPRNDYLGDAAFQPEIVEIEKGPETNGSSLKVESIRSDNRVAQNHEADSSPGSAIDPNKIGLWGTVESGKTTFLAVLYHVMNDDEWRIYGKGEANAFIQEMYSYVFDRREFPPPTGEDDVLFYEYELYHDPGGPTSDHIQEYMFSFVDASGEAFRKPQQWRASHPDKTHPLDVLKQCGKIICLLDAEPFLPSRSATASRVEPGEYFRDIFSLLSTVREHDPNRVHGQISSHRFAFCISKCDVPAIWEHRDNAARFAERIFSPNVIREIRRYIPSTHYSWHAFSSVGPYLNDEQMDSPVIDGKIRPEHDIRPYGVKEIIASLFAPEVDNFAEW